MSEPRTLETVLADRREQATVLRRSGHENDAKLLDAFADDVAAAAEPWLRFLSESEARLRSGWSQERLRTLYRQLEPAGHAEKRPGHGRYYRACFVPRRPDLIRAREAGRRGERLERAQ